MSAESIKETFNTKSIECVKLAWSFGFDLFRVRRVARSRVRIGVGLG